VLLPSPLPSPTPFSVNARCFTTLYMISVLLPSPLPSSTPLSINACYFTTLSTLPVRSCLSLWVVPRKGKKPQQPLSALNNVTVKPLSALNNSETCVKPEKQY
jgi:hypothetical protein